VIGVVGFVPMVPGRGPAGAAPAPGPAVFAAGAEAWAYSVEVGVPGPLGPLASHTTVSIDNSPHAQGAAGLADPGYLVRAAAQLVAGVPTPMYCESAWPEGPEHVDCGAPGSSAAVSRTAAGAGPGATATAGLGAVAVGSGAGGPGAAAGPGGAAVGSGGGGPGAAAGPGGAAVGSGGGAPVAGASASPALTIDAQSTTSGASLGTDGLLQARADVTLSGIAVAGGALRIGTLSIHREAAASGLPGGTQTSAVVALGGATVAGTPVEPGRDPVRNLAEAARKAFGDTIVVEGLGGSERQTPDGKLAADSAGLQITWHPAKDRSVRIVLGYGRVSVYATPPVAASSELPLPATDEPVAGPGGAPSNSPPGPEPALAPRPAAPVLASSPPERVAAGAAAPAPPPVAVPPGAGAVGPATGESTGATTTPGGAAAPLVAVGRPLGAAARRPVQWVSPFLILAQMTTGRQVWWSLLALGPLIVAAWLSRRGGLGLIAPWSRR
jgi:hypothetical protein